MLEDAIRKIEAEKLEKQDNPYVTYIADYLVDKLKSNPSWSEKILDEGKTILGSLTYMRGEASKVKKGGVAMFTPDEGFKIVLDYFGIDEVKESKSNKGKIINISLDDLL